ncbi:hypothetical protein HYH03_013762 [Edaphochlamys debaryana]|uniref:Uncharacterized protein n=1 Tax=Edaphochlamys debaryana TaxID=47281 RepID=A0A835XP41_9CHLO|nr:hypothetical protein HYH03_013762 [Edaphochlamys debaryana]|eukprot:KAG2487623.1 hypothetical protein HYH03_013762 [Edaphochlamys debaryana]
MSCGAAMRLPAAGARVGARPCLPRRTPQFLRPLRAPLLVRASAGDGPPQMPEPQGPQEISLTRRIPGAGATFMLAGALKIMTVGWIASSAPRGCVRTAAGQYAQFGLLPVGLLLCVIAKWVVDNGLHESRRFMGVLLGITAFLYFGLYSVFYKYEPRTWSAQQQLQAAAAQSRTPYDPQAVDNRSKFIIQRQLEGEYDARTSAYYSRAPEMQMAEVDERVSSLPAGMVQGGGAAVGPTTAERGVGEMPRRAPARGQQGRGVRSVVPSMYDSTPRIPGLDSGESDF